MDEIKNAIRWWELTDEERASVSEKEFNIAHKNANKTALAALKTMEWIEKENKNPVCHHMARKEIMQQFNSFKGA